MRGPLHAAALSAVLWMAGCAVLQADIEISHVHGIAYDGESLYLATHHGLVRRDTGGHWSYIGDPYDHMGFTQDARRPGTLYTSGHPDDAQAFGAVHLGLRRSVDGGVTWEQRSLKGEVDFHALTSLPAEGWLAGYWQGMLKVSTDAGATWTDFPAPPAHALAGAPGRLLAATPQGLRETADLETFANWSAVPADGLPGGVATIASSPDGRVLMAWAGGASHRSVDGGSWEAVPIESDAPVVFAFDPFDPTHVWASSADARVWESKDGGTAWTVVRDRIS